MTRLQAPEPNSRQEQSVLFRSNIASRNGSEAMNALRAENLKLGGGSGMEKIRGDCLHARRVLRAVGDLDAQEETETSREEIPRTRHSRAS